MLNKELLIEDLKQLHKKLVNVYSNLFIFKYKNQPNFKKLIDAEYAKESLQGIDEKELWNQQYFHRSAYTLINKILFIRICEDKGFMLNERDKAMGEDLNGQKISMVGLGKWKDLVSNYSLSELVRFAFNDMNKSYNDLSLYKEDKYDWLIPTKEDVDFYYLNEEYKENDSIRKFEEILEFVIETLDTSKYNFGKSSDNVLGDVYEKFMDRETRKSLGQFYTPDFIIEIILKNTISDIDIVKNPFVKLLDPACGSGHFLIMAYDLLREKFEDNLEKLQQEYKNSKYEISYRKEVIQLSGEQYWTIEHLHYHLLKNCIYGADIDEFAIQLTTINLLLKDLENITDDLNIISCNSLIKWEKEYDWRKYKEEYREGVELLTYIENEDHFLDYNQINEIVRNGEFWSNDFDFIVGNPPYVGQKGNKEIFEFFKTNKYWKDFYERKQDLYYYFISRGIEKLKEHGKLAYINPPYWLTAFATTTLKSEIKSKANLLKVYDFKGKMIFDDAHINGNIFVFKKKVDNTNSPIRIFEYSHHLKGFNVYTSHLNNDDLDLGMWNVYHSNESKNYFNNVTSICLGDIANISPGIQTGADRVSTSHIKKLNLKNMKVSEGIFVLTKEELAECNFNEAERQFVKPFYKNSVIEKYCFNTSTEECFIVTNKIDDIDKYPNIKRHLLKYKDILDARYRNYALINADKEGKWYYLYGYRPNTNFDGEKIVTPYRSKSTNFSYSTIPMYACMDVFYIDITDNNYNIYYLLGVMNSDLVLYWLLKNGKMKGENLELISEPLSKIPIPSNISTDIVNKIAYLTKELITKKDNLIKMIDMKTNKIILESSIKESIKYLYKEIRYAKEELIKLNNQINSLVFKLFNLTQTDEEEILDYLTKKQLDNTFQNQLLLLIDDNVIKEKLDSLLIKAIKNYLVKRKEASSTADLYKILERDFDNLYEIMTILKDDAITKKSTQVINDRILKSNSESVKQFINKRNNFRPTGDFIRYDNEIYGLSEWSDETHRKYFINAIDYYTSNSVEKYEGTIFNGIGKTKRKAETALKNLSQLDFEDKEEYLKILTDKVKKAFN